MSEGLVEVSGDVCLGLTVLGMFKKTEDGSWTRSGRQCVIYLQADGMSSRQQHNCLADCSVVDECRSRVASQITSSSRLDGLCWDHAMSRDGIS